MLSRSSLHGYLVHIYTASTLIFVALGIQWVLNGKFRLALIAMIITILIDATDGMLARKFRVKETAASVDGALLDNIVDFLSYVLLPLLFMVQAKMLLEPVTVWLSLVMFASAFGFSKTTAKLADKGFFEGFPSYWNILVFYLYLLQTPATFNTGLIALLSGLVFVPLRFLYISRLKRWRTLHFSLGALWGSLCLYALSLNEGSLRTGLLYLSMAYVIFYTLHSLWLDFEGRLPQWRISLLKR
ncbi:MAG: CDP-alcohol phosphatidyltransferase family protein [Trueperaceae bacterium]|nr:CDP-alcohol phosphatidyltransferase family protein [Trueperaceae bacterium]